MQNRLRNTLLALVLLASPTVAIAASSFPDVPADYPMYEHITQLADRGIIRGYADGRYRPWANMTRAEAAKVALGAAGIAVVSTQLVSFSDVPVAHGMHDVVETAKAKSILRGFPDGTFRPDLPVTRGEMARLLLSALGLVQDKPAMSPSFTDVPPSHSHALPIYSARAQEIVGGFADGSFRPDAPVTRGQAAKIVLNSLLVKEGKAPLASIVTPAHSALELQLFNLINASRASQKLPALTLDPALSAIARTHSQDLLTTFKSLDKEGWAAAHPNEVGPWITHDAGDGISFEKRLPAALADAGIANKGATENVGWATFNARTPETANQVIHDAMMAEVAPDDGHRRNILGQSLDATHVGIGIATGENPKELYATTDFVLK